MYHERIEMNKKKSTPVGCQHKKSLLLVRNWQKMQITLPLAPSYHHHHRQSPVTQKFSFVIQLLRYVIFFAKDIIALRIALKNVITNTYYDEISQTSIS